MSKFGNKHKKKNPVTPKKKKSDTPGHWRNIAKSMFSDIKGKIKGERYYK